MWNKYYLGMINSILCGTNTILVWSTLYYVVQILSWCDPDVLCTQLVPLFATCTGLRWHFYNGYYMGVGVTLISIIVSPLVYYCDSQQYFFRMEERISALIAFTMYWRFLYVIVLNGTWQWASILLYTSKKLIGKIFPQTRV